MSKRWQVVLIVAVFLLAVVGITSLLNHKPGGVHFFQKGRAEGLLQKGKEAFSEGKFDEALQYYTETTQISPTDDLAAQGYLGIGDVQFGEGHLLEAHDTYEKIIQEFPNTPTTVLAQERLGKTQMAILFSPLMTPLYKKIEVRPGDTLGKIAKSHNTTVELLMKANGLKSSLILPGMKLKIPASHFSILVDKSQNTLTLKAGDEIFKVYPVATGENDTTPVGKFKIVNKLVDPVWYALGAVVPPDSPENVLGSRWLGINEPGYGIHGTRDPDSIGKPITRGCVRMQNRDVEELYTVVPIGTEVVIID